MPGEHDVFVDQGKRYLQFFGKGSRGTGYYSFDYRRSAFPGAGQRAGIGGGSTGGKQRPRDARPEQLEFIKKDLAAVSSETPVVIFGHVPLLAVYPQWGWATADSAQVLEQLRRFGSVTALNGHIHQIISKTEGNIVMHTAAPPPTRCTHRATSRPEPLVVPAGALPSRIGIRTAMFTRGSSSLALVDESLAGGSPPASPHGLSSVAPSYDSPRDGRVERVR